MAQERNDRFPPTSRLRVANDFGRVFKKNVRSADSCFTILARRNGLNGPRLGLAIARKMLRLAVSRNRVKRIVRESFRLAQHELPPVDIVVLARPGVGECDNRSLHASLGGHWKTLRRKLGADDSETLTNDTKRNR